MKKYIITLALTVGCVLSGAAENLKDALKVTFTDDTTPVTVILDDAPEITYSETSMTITVPSGTPVSYTFDSIKDVTFTKVGSGISGITDASIEKSLYIGRTQSGFILRGMDKSSPVTVYNISGQAVAAGEADADGGWFWDTSSTQGGVYIIRTGKQSTKVAF